MWSCLFFHVCPSTCTPAQKQEIYFFKFISSPKSNIHWQTVKPECLKKEMFNSLGKLNFEKTETKVVFVPILSPSSPHLPLSFARWMEHTCSAISQLATDKEVKWYRQHYPEINQREPDTARQVDKNKGNGERTKRGVLVRQSEGYSIHLHRGTETVCNTKKKKIDGEKSLRLAKQTPLEWGINGFRDGICSLQNKIPSLDLHKYGK